MGLREYIKKRNFNNTAEPEGIKARSKGNLKFVVQRHHASHLHYDFRLELDGVLKSWAVPKGPSLNPKDKRLVMMVEDHPYNYRNFEGTIPKGNYGAGLVTIFDEGTYESLIPESGEKELKRGLAAGDLKFRLYGKILKGDFALVKLKNSNDNSWLLIKHRDEFSVDGEFNSEDIVSEKIKELGIDQKSGSKNDTSSKSKVVQSSVLQKTPLIKDSLTKVIPYKPMLARLASDIFDDEQWIFEKKVDGYRALAYVSDGVNLISRNGIDFGNKYKNIITSLKKLSVNAVIDGEIVAEDESGRADFQGLQNNASLAKHLTIKYYAFDLLALDGHDLRHLELIKRKELLEALLKNLNDSSIIYNAHVLKNGTKLFAEAAEKDWEGIIGKDGTSRYESNRRSDRWLKFKLQNSQEAIIIGYTKPAGSRKYFGSLVLGMYNENKKLVYIGNCGTGFNESSLKDIFRKMQELVTDKKPVSEKVNQEKTATWLRPALVCEVTFTEWTADKHLRHPVFKGLRADKNKEEVKQEKAGISSNKTGLKSDMKTKSKSGDISLKGTGQEERFGKKVVKLTNLDKLYWKNDKISKGQLIEYYRSVSDYILPFLKDRPQSLNRHPNGIEGPNFFQKDLDTDQIPGWIKYQPMYSESVNKDIDYLICNDLPTLLWMVNLGCIEINPWLSTYKIPEKPIFAVLDLDPNDVDDFSEVVKVALTAKNILNNMGISPWIKTSGSRGLHIYIYVAAKYEYETIKNFIQYLGQLIMAEHPDTTSLERSPSKRRKKICLDFLQNRRGQTIAAPYSARPKPGATVSTPLTWEEVNENLDIKAFTIFNTMQRINDRGDLWKDILKEKADLKAALKNIK